MSWGNLFGKPKRYDKDGNEIDENGNIIAPALGVQVPGGALKMPGVVAGQPNYAPSVQAPSGGGLQMPANVSDYVAQIAPDATAPSAGSGVMSAAATGAGLGGTLGSIIPGVGNVIGTAAGTVLGAIGGAVNANSEEKKAEEEHNQKVRDAQAEQQRMDQLLNYKRQRDTQSTGFERLKFLSDEADKARVNSRTKSYRDAMVSALGY
jgi:outer membrane lipoprotein SlyB